ncbi:MAG: hypothetical protein K8M05_34695 [Deltaproteobacteria bacterium]|nr:hypothetical protein [Kofleriaceae bacterium]
MSLNRLHVASLLFAFAATFAAAGCGASHQAQLNVLSVEKATTPDKDMVVYVEVVNRAKRPMRLQRLQYTFAPAGSHAKNAQLELELELGERLVEAGSAVVVEVPLPVADMALGETLTLAGRLWAEQDQILRSFSVAAEVATPVEQAP